MVTITGTLIRATDGTPHQGRGFIEPSVPVLLDTAGKKVRLGGHRFTLDAAGSFSVTVPATDDPTLSPTGFTYTLALRLDGGETFAPLTFTAPAAVPTVDITALTVAATTTPVTPSQYVALDARLTAEAATRAAAVSDAARRDPQPWPAAVTLLAGQADETLTVTGCTATGDATTKRLGARSHLLTIASATTATAKLPAFGSGPVSVKASAVGLLIYIPNPALITALTMQVYTGPTDVDNWSFNITALRGGLAANLVAGWNVIRWTPSHRTQTGTPTAWGNADHVRVVVGTNAATTVNVQQVWLETRPKASLLFITDGGYSLFDRSPGYNDLRDRSIPVTWSVDCGLIGDANHVTEARLAELAAENHNSVSFHGWDGTSTATMTGPQLVDHTMRCLRWLAARGYTGRIWRSAWLQNSAPNSAATDSLVLANAMNGVDTFERVHAWPFHDPMNVVRVVLHGKTPAQIDTLFAELEANRGVCVAYTHRVNAAGGTDITPTEWAYLLTKIDAAVAAGWLEGVTFEDLYARAGGRLVQGLGTTVAEYRATDGTATAKVLP